jgi:hypothetical protein
MLAAHENAFYSICGEVGGQFRVESIGVGSEFEHVTEHCDAAASRDDVGAAEDL